jgi:glycosyltransferase involved in cell wall biosynthesis
MIGHSIGEYVAACLGGLWTLGDALRLVALRGRLMQSLPPGDMLSVQLPEAELARRIAPPIAIAAVNGPSLAVASGPPGAIGELAARHAGLGARIKLLGKLPRGQLRYLHRIADLALVPSIYEPFGFTAIETMASGVPVIVSAAGGLAEIVRDGESGRHVPVHPVAGGERAVAAEALAAAQLALLADPDSAQRLGQAGQRRVAELFQVARMIDGNLDCYRRLLGRRAEPRRVHADERTQLA